jgi:hypothetical protein
MWILIRIQNADPNSGCGIQALIACKSNADPDPKRWLAVTVTFLYLLGLEEGLSSKRSRPPDDLDMVLNTPLVGEDLLTDPLARIVNE